MTRLWPWTGWVIGSLRGYIRFSLWISSFPVLVCCFASPDAWSSTLAYDQTHDSFWLANPDQGTISCFNGELVWQQEWVVGGRPSAVVVGPGGIYAFDGQFSRGWRWPLGAVSKGVQPSSFSLPHGSGITDAHSDMRGSILVVAGGRGEIFRLKEDGTVIERLFLGFDLGRATYSEDRDTFWIAQARSRHGQARIYQVNARQWTISKKWEWGPRPLSSITPKGFNEHYLVNGLMALWWDPEGQRLVVGSKADNVHRGLQRNGKPYDPWSISVAALTYLTTHRNSSADSHTWPMPQRNLPSFIAPIPTGRGNLLAIGYVGSNVIDVVRPASEGDSGGGRTLRHSPGTFGRSEGVCHGPIDALWDKVRQRLVVHCFLGPHLASWRPLMSPSWDRMVPASRHLSTNYAALAGKRVFYNGSDPRMSASGQISCATCHFEGGEDGQIWDFTQAGEGLRNTVSLLGRRGMGHGRLHWTGNFDEVQDFEHDIRRTFGGLGFIANTLYMSDKQHPLGRPKKGLSRDLDHLAVYLQSLSYFPESPFRGADGKKTREAIQGRYLFNEIGCNDCHKPTGEFTDSSIDQMILHDVGTKHSKSGDRLGEPLNGFDTPTLIGVWQTPPYGHDGFARSIPDVFAGQTIVNGHDYFLQVSEEERRSLEQFMLQLEGHEVDPLLEWFSPESSARVVDSQSLSADFPGQVFIQSANINKEIVVLRGSTSSVSSHVTLYLPRPARLTVYLPATGPVDPDYHRIWESRDNVRGGITEYLVFTQDFEGLLRQRIGWLPNSWLVIQPKDRGGLRKQD